MAEKTAIQLHLEFPPGNCCVFSITLPILYLIHCHLDSLTKDKLTVTCKNKTLVHAVVPKYYIDGVSFEV